MENPPYETYIGKSKEERREIISSSGALERKRFLLSDSPELQERIRRLQKTIYEMKEKHPELISLNLFGSFIKGYATSESDLDAYLMIDDGISAQNKTEPAAILDDVKEHIKKELNLTNNQVLAIQLDGWNEERIKKFIEANMTASLSRFFLFSIGKDISNYRKLILDNLELNKVSGPKKWKGIMDSLRIQESIGFSTEVMDRRRKLYPQTLAEGRKYFLRESAAEPT